MENILTPLTLDFLAWLAAGPRPYSDVMEAWRTTCPRLTVWEDAIDSGLVAHAHAPGQPPLVALTPRGKALLAAHRHSGSRARWCRVACEGASAHMESMWNDEDSPPPRAPISEPEILPAERVDPRRPGAGQIWMSEHRITFTRPGPFQLLLGFFVLAAIVGIGALVLLGLALLWLPILGATVIALLIAGLFRAPRRP